MAHYITMITENGRKRNKKTEFGMPYTGNLHALYLLWSLSFNSHTLSALLLKKQTALTLSVLSSPFGTTAPFSPKSAQPFLVSSKLSAANPALFYLVATYSHPCDLERGCSKRPNEVAKRGLVSDSANSMELACYMVLHSWPETSRGSVHGEDNRLA